MKIVIVGVGRRIREWYDPVLSQLEKNRHLHIAGCYNRTQQKAKQFARKHNAILATSVEQLLEKTKPDAAIISVPGKLRQKYAQFCLAKGISVLIETPMAYNTKDAHKLMWLAKKNNCIIESVEDKALYPTSMLAQQVVKHKALGNVIAVFNEEFAHVYHGLAFFSTLFDTDIKPIAYDVEKTKFVNGTSLVQKYVKTKDGILYCERFTEPKQSIARIAPSWKIVCAYGVITDKGAFYKNEKTQETEFAPFVKTKKAYTIKIRNTTFKQPITNVDWADKHHSLHILLEAFLKAAKQKDASKPLYGSKRALTDIRMWKSMQILSHFPFMKQRTLLHGSEKILGYR